MILFTLDHCGAVFHGCGKGNEEVLERPQKHGGGTVLNIAHLSTEHMVTSLRQDTLTRKATILIWLKSTSREWPKVISLHIFILKDIILMNVTLGIRTN